MNTKKAFLLVALALIVAGGAFAQRVGDTVQVSGQSWTVQELSNGRMVLQLAPSLNGVWVSERGTDTTINGNTGVLTAISPTYALYQDAVNKGYIKVGDTIRRNLTSSGNLRWTGEVLEVTYGSNSNVATGTRWVNATITLSADGQSFRSSNVNFSFTRRQ